MKSSKGVLIAILVVLWLPELAMAEEGQQKRGVLEGYNRAMHTFNTKVDDWVLRPVARSYHAVTPNALESGISNFFSNLGEVINIPNDLLQGKFKMAANDTGRFLINSVFGIAGLFEVADEFGLRKNEGEDLGQTLAVWGVPSGPYVVVPFLGPSTLRDFPSNVADRMLFSPIRQVDNVSLRNSLYALQLVDLRASLLNSEELMSGDKYEFLRQVYLQRREYLINDGQVEDDFGDYSDDPDLEY